MTDHNKLKTELTQRESELENAENAEKRNWDEAQRLHDLTREAQKRCCTAEAELAWSERKTQTQEGQ